MNSINDNLDMELLRKKLKKRRLFLGMTYNDLSQKTGISKSSLQRYESGGIKNISYEKILILSDALQVNSSYFLNLENECENNYFETTFQNRIVYLDKIKTYEQEAIRNLCPFLIDNGFSIENTSKSSIGDLIAKKGNLIWYFEFLYFYNQNNEVKTFSEIKKTIINIFGRLAIYQKNITKFSIVLNDPSLIEKFINLKPLYLNIEISLIILKNNSFDEIILK